MENAYANIFDGTLKDASVTHGGFKSACKLQQQQKLVVTSFYLYQHPWSGSGPTTHTHNTFFVSRKRPTYYNTEQSCTQPSLMPCIEHSWAESRFNNPAPYATESRVICHSIVMTRYATLLLHCLKFSSVGGMGLNCHVVSKSGMAGTK